MPPEPQQQWDPVTYAQQAPFVSELGLPLLELLAPRAGERMLDLGCGDGTLTRRLVELGCQVVGLDASEAMVQAARARGVDARLGDGNSLATALGFGLEGGVSGGLGQDAGEPFDAVVSNAAIHWMTAPEAVIAGVRQVLRPRGRFVGEFGGHGNVATIVTAIETALEARGIQPPSPWFFPRAETWADLLNSAGFQVSSLALLPRPTPLPGDLGGWLETFDHPFSSLLAPADRPAFREEVEEALHPVLRDQEGRCVADYVRLRFSTTKVTRAVAGAITGEWKGTTW